MMKKLHFAFLSAQDLPVLHQTFLKAFEDYIVPIQLNEDQFKAKLQREGIDPNYCVAAYDGELMVGFILTGLGEWQGKPTAYNGGTGVIPAFRGQRLTQQLYNLLIKKLRESGVEYCLLEVIEQNKPALKSYLNLGMEITRSLNCYRSKIEYLILDITITSKVQVKRAPKPNWDNYQRFWDIEPSWQNSVQSVKRSINDALIIEAYDEYDKLNGYLILYPKSGAIAQLAVSKDSRSQGIGTSLLIEAANLSQNQMLMCMNVDSDAKEINEYLTRRNFAYILKQHEMLLQLV